MTTTRPQPDSIPLMQWGSIHDPKLEESLYETFVKMRDLLDHFNSRAVACRDDGEITLGRDGEIRVRLTNRIEK